MAIEKWKPFGMLTSLQRDINRLFEGFWPIHRGEWARETFAPSVDVSEDGDNIYVTAEVPGMDEKDIKVNFQNGVLTLSGEKKEEKETREKNYHSVERVYGSFSRSVSVPAQVNAQKAAAKFKNGVLTVTFPKLEEAKPKEITIKPE